ncbi:hypothetical protein [Halocynthiibacter sp.]|uniref:hypothetical protein n=1 Tax=Halocynthiibacter sp. TaxID=1979210 RepID=UPI003C6F8AD3
MSFIKTTPGKACKIVSILNAEWVQKPHSLVKEAYALDGTIIAYTDVSGWFTANAYADVDTSGVEA